MANALTIDVSSFNKAIADIGKLSKEIQVRVDDELNIAAEDIATKAKQLAPVDMGGLRAHISANNSKQFEKHISVNAVYAAWIEFGTGSYAAQYVATLPETWQQYAAQFRGKTGQTGFLEKIQEWVRRKGIGTAKDYKSIGYLIYRKILKYGIHPHPYLFPAYEQVRPELLKNIENAFKSL